MEGFKWSYPCPENEIPGKFEINIAVDRILVAMDISWNEV